MQVIMDRYIVFIAIWCLILNTYIVVSCNKTKSLEDREKKRVQNYIYFISTGILVLDLCTYKFTGSNTNAARWIVSIVSYALYLFKYMYLTAFTMFMMKYTKKLVLVKKGLLAVSVLIGVVGMLFLSLPGVREDFYYLDDYNYLHYGEVYCAIRFLFILDVVIMLIALLVEKKYYRKGTFNLYLGYCINLMLTGLLDYYIDAWYLQNMAIFFSTMIIFIDNMTKVSDKWQDARKELIFSEYRASHDLMTGLWNKSSGMQQIRDYLEKMTEGDMAVLGFVDIDDFKSVNDNYGHEVGDFWIVRLPIFWCLSVIRMILCADTAVTSISFF